MKVEIRTLEDLEPYFRYQKIEGIFTQKLQSILNVTELKQKWLKELNPLANEMKQLRQKYHFKTNEDIKKQIMKHAGY